MIFALHGFVEILVLVNGQEFDPPTLHFQSALAVSSRGRHTFLPLGFMNCSRTHLCSRVETVDVVF
jgi:hypothetical protein